MLCKPVVFAEFRPLKPKQNPIRACIRFGIRFQFGFGFAIGFKAFHTEGKKFINIL